jgi:3-deoxy-7-phosphoheptulonate synthase
MILRFDDGEHARTAVPLLSELSLTVHRVVRNGETFLATSGDERRIPWERVRSLAGLREVIETPPPFYFAARAAFPADTAVFVGDVAIGGGADPVVIAGPCAVENRADTLEAAAAVKAAGARIFRAGVFKPRTTPYNYQGIGREGLAILAEVRADYGLPVVTEVLDPLDIPAVAEHADAIQVGTRNMTNSALLKHLGSAGKPVLLKRGFASPIDELVRAAEFVIVHGNPEVILCERGIKTFEPYTRFTLDLSAVPALKELTHLPVVVDPSHATGRPSLIPPMSRAAVVAGADGLMIECHPRPEDMIKPGDAEQALLPVELAEIVASVDVLRRAVDSLDSAAVPS